MDIYEELKGLIAALQREGDDYALWGGFALAAHGIVRATEDIDLLVTEECLPKIRHTAEALGFRFNKTPLVFKDGGVKIFRCVKTDPASEDFLVLDLLQVSPLTQPAWDSRSILETDFGPARVVSPSGLIHLKSLRRSGQDEDDIRQLEALGNSQ